MGSFGSRFIELNKFKFSKEHFLFLVQFVIYLEHQMY